MWAVPREGYSTYFVQKINKVDVKGFLAEMFANHLEDRAFQNERIVHRHEAHALHAVPAGLAAAGDARVHDVIRHEEIGLELAWVIELGRCMAEKGRRTHSTDQPRTAALKYSDSVSSRPLRIATESTTLKPRLSFPPGTL